MLDGFAAWTEEEKKEVILAYNNAINEWVAQRTFQIFEKLGGEADYFENVLTAAGDGSTTSGLFEEREKDERGRWNKGRSEEHTSELQSRPHLVCRLLLEKKNIVGRV